MPTPSIFAIALLCHYVAHSIFSFDRLRHHRARRCRAILRAPAPCRRCQRRAADAFVELPLLMLAFARRRAAFLSASCFHFDAAERHYFAITPLFH